MLVTAISIVSAIVLAQNGHAGSNPFKVKVDRRPVRLVVHLPERHHVRVPDAARGPSHQLDITSKDVIHSFWVPQLEQKQDAVPGQHNKLVVTPTRTGTFPVICTELCGLGHSLMRSHVTILNAADFAKWQASGGKAAPTPASPCSRRTAAAAATPCKAAGANGKIGPDLDNLKQEAAKANRVRSRRSSRSRSSNPAAYLEPGYQDQMPHSSASRSRPTSSTSSCSIWPRTHTE